MALQCVCPAITLALSTDAHDIQFSDFIHRAARLTVKKVILLSAGWVMIITGPVIGIIPGPTGLPIMAAGAMIVMSQSRGARRAFIRYQQRFPQTLGPVRRFIQRRKNRRNKADNP